MKTISMACHCGESIRNRHGVAVLLGSLSREKYQLDFTNITFVSRSAGDEIINFMASTNSVAINTCDAIKELFAVIEKGRHRKREFGNLLYGIYKPTSLKELKTIIANW